MKKFLTIILTIFMMFAIGIMSACEGEVANNSNVNNNAETQKTVNVEEAIILAQNDSIILNKIANRFDLIFYATPNWGLCDGEIYTGTQVTFDDKGTPFYKLTLAGTISGYTDSYKTDLSYGNKFKIVAYVSIYGEVAPNISFLSTWY